MRDFGATNVQVFPDAATRDTVITAPIAGQQCFTTTDKNLWIYSGGAWYVVTAADALLGLQAGTPRVIQEAKLAANSGTLGSAIALTGMSCAVTPVAGKSYYGQFGLQATPSVSQFHTWSFRNGSTAGALLGQVVLVQSNLASLYFNALVPLSNVPTGSAITIVLCVSTNTGTITIQAANPTNALMQILERG